MLKKQGKNVTKTEKKVVLCKPTPLNDYRDLKMFTGIYSDSQGKSFIIRSATRGKIAVLTVTIL